MELSNEATAIFLSQHTNARILCPICAKDRRHKNPTCRVTSYHDRVVWKCHHCDKSGVVMRDQWKTSPVALKKKEGVSFIPTQLTQDEQIIQDFFARRGVTITDMSVLPPMTTGLKYFHGQGELPAVGFVYGPKDQPYAIKWRACERKAFTQDNAAADFYGLNQLPEQADEVIIVEGEADVVALATLGVKAISVPNGAPQKVSKGRITPEEDGKFAYVWEAREILDRAKRILLATDQDEPGEALSEEIARRVGRAKCWRIKYPAGCKDFTDVIREHGAEAVAEAINKAEELPLSGVYSTQDYTGELYEIYREGYGKGESTGMEVVDDLFTIKPGQLTVVTGLPGMGKSEFVDQIVLNLAQNSHWKFAVASFENPPPIHIAKLAEKITGKPFFQGITPRMKQQELDDAVGFIKDHFVFLQSRDGHLPTIDSIIDRTKQAIMRLGVRGLVIDPFNYINLRSHENEHQAISQMLSQLTAFAQAHDIHVFFVAHPAKQYMKDDGTYPVPTGMSISGSAAWFAKADVGITVHRGKMGVEIHCWKVRFKWIGKQGMCVIGYDVPSGRYIHHSRTVQEEIPAHTPRAKLAADKLRHWQDDWDDLEF